MPCSLLTIILSLALILMALVAYKKITISLNSKYNTSHSGLLLFIVALVLSLWIGLHLYPKQLSLNVNKPHVDEVKTEVKVKTKSKDEISIYFQTKKGDTYTYYPYTKDFYTRFEDLISDKDYLYYSKCDLPKSDKNCDIYSSWRKFPKIAENIPFQKEKIPKIKQASQDVPKKEYGQAVDTKVDISNPLFWGGNFKFAVVGIVLMFLIQLILASKKLIFIEPKSPPDKQE